MNSQQYLVCCADTPKTLEQIVCEKLAEGWQLVGGVSVAAFEQSRGDAGGEWKESNFTYCQAITKETSKWGGPVTRQISDS